jgi:hypothetical protein
MSGIACGTCPEERDTADAGSDPRCGGDGECTSGGREASRMPLTAERAERRNAEQGHIPHMPFWEQMWSGKV